MPKTKEKTAKMKTLLATLKDQREKAEESAKLRKQIKEERGKIIEARFGTILNVLDSLGKKILRRGKK